MITTISWPAISSRRATGDAPASAAPGEIPPGMPSTRASSRVSASVSSLPTVTTSSICDSSSIGRAGASADEGTTFALHDKFAKVTEAIFTQAISYLVHLDGSVRGLRPGAPVEFRGMKVGRATDLRLEIDAAKEAITIPVTLALQPERITVVGERPNGCL